MTIGTLWLIEYLLSAENSMFILRFCLKWLKEKGNNKIWLKNIQCVKDDDLIVHLWLNKTQCTHIVLKGAYYDKEDILYCIEVLKKQ